jgi:NAD(P)-dependent dehydrogenase (short-subunit alcohol dehydrogenase family)
VQQSPTYTDKFQSVSFDPSPLSGGRYRASIPARWSAAGQKDIALTEPLSLEGQRIVITGAGNGLGRAYARLLAERGARIVVNDVLGEAADAVVAEIRAKGGEAVASYDPVGSKAAGQAIVQVAFDAFGGLDALVNNAGIARPALFEDMSEADMEDVLRVHLHGSIYTTQAAWPFLQKQKYGRILMTSSTSGMFGNPGMVNYSAAKSGVYGLAKALAYEGLDYDIAVNVLLPVAGGGTAMSKNLVIPTLAENYAKFMSPELRQKVKTEANQSPELIAPMVAYLVSPECAYTGEAYSICRGRYGRVFVGVADGWLTRKGPTISPEDIRDRLPEIRDIDHHSVPKWLFEETADVARRLFE